MLVLVSVFSFKQEKLSLSDFIKIYIYIIGSYQESRRSRTRTNRTTSLASMLLPRRPQMTLEFVFVMVTGAWT